MKKPKKAGRVALDEEDEKNEFSNNHQHKIRYIPSKEEEEILEPFKDKYPSNYIFTNLISESIKFSYDKDPKTFVPKDTINSRVIEEEIVIPQTETDGSLKKNMIIESDRNERNGISKISEENKNENNKSNSEEEKNVNMKELMESIPIRVSFLGVQKN